ncbi:MAG: hypothetical protein ACP5NW_00220 [Candidatus Woesearchaeota archaeon]
MEREVSEVDRKLILKKTYLDRIYYNLTRNPIGQDELYSLVRKFFGEYLKLDYEFTYEELSQELNKVFIRPKVKEHIDDFLIRLSESEYLEESHVDTKTVNAFLKELDEIIRNMIYEEQSTQAEESFIQKVLNKKGKDSHDAIDIKSINGMIEELNFHISSGSLDVAKSSYVNLIKAYDALNKSDKKKLHDAMNEVYERLQTLIKNPRPAVPENSGIAVKNVKDMIDETTFYINASNLSSAKLSYSELIKAYESLSIEEKKPLHSMVNELYMQLHGMSSKPSKIDSQIQLLSKTIEEAHGEEQVPAATSSKETDSISMPSKDESSDDVSLDITSNTSGTSLLSKTALSSAESNMRPIAYQQDAQIPNKSYTAEDKEFLKQDTDESTVKSSGLSNPVVDFKDGNMLFVAGSNVNESIINSSDSVIASRVPTQEKTAVSSTNIANQSKISISLNAKDMSAKESPSKVSSVSSTIGHVKTAGEIESDRTSQAVIDRLTDLLDKIMADVVLDKFEAAKETYKDALLIYRKMDDVQKSRCYDKFYKTFKKLDDSLHQRSLHELLDKHTSDIKSSKRTISADASAPESDHTESIRISKMPTLPMLLSNDEQTTRVYELIEESYFNIDNRHTDLAMLKYFKALDIYKMLSVEDKKKLYSGLHDLFKKLSLAKKIC